MTKLIVMNVMVTFALIGAISCKKDDDKPFPKDFDPTTQGDYFVSPSGLDSNPGTYEMPFETWQKAFDTAEKGDTVYFRGGVYYSIGEATHPKLAPYQGHGNSGSKDSLICFFNFPGETPILDCTGQYPRLSVGGTISSGIEVAAAQYIHFKGLTIRNLYQRGNSYLPQGITLTYPANIIWENMVIHDISGRGVFGAGMTGYYDKSVTPVIIYSDETRWINCDFYNLCDSSSNNPGNAADGIKFTHNGRTSTEYPFAIWYLEGCRFWNYSDDGTDIGGAAVVIHNNCWVSSTDKYLSVVPEGNGFKSGGVFFQFDKSDSLLTTPWRIFTNCIAVNCVGNGFYDLQYADYHKTYAQFYNNLSYNNGIGFTSNPGQAWWKPRRSTVYRNNISLGSNNGGSYEPAIYRPSIYVESNNTWDATQKEDDWPGWVWSSDSVSTKDFESLDASLLFEKPRQEDGSLPITSFGHLKTTSKLIGAGMDVGMSKVPDIGIDWDWIDQ